MRSLPVPPTIESLPVPPLMVALPLSAVDDVVAGATNDRVVARTPVIVGLPLRRR